MSNEQKHPTCLVALRAEIGAVAIDLEKRLENRVEQVEQAYSSLGWEMDTLRSNLKSADKDAALLQEANASLNARIGNLQETNAALTDRLNRAEIAYRELVNTDNEALAKHTDKIADLQSALATMFTPAQVCERVNAVHDEVMAKLSAERKELELTQKLLATARLERDEARIECSRRLMENRGLRNLNRAQGGRIAELQAVGPALDILADMVKETQQKLETAHAQRDDLDADYGKLVGEYEDLSKLFDLLRNLIMDPTFTADDLKTQGNGVDRYTAFARALRIGRHEAKLAIHRLVQAHPICVELQQQVDVLCKRLEQPTERLTKAEALHLFKDQAFNLLQCVINLTSKDVRALQYGPHHGHQQLYKHIQAFNRKFAPCFGESEVLRDEG